MGWPLYSSVTLLRFRATVRVLVHPRPPCCSGTKMRAVVATSKPLFSMDPTLSQMELYPVVRGTGRATSRSSVFFS